MTVIETIEYLQGLIDEDPEKAEKQLDLHITINDTPDKLDVFDIGDGELEIY